MAGGVTCRAGLPNYRLRLLAPGSPGATAVHGDPASRVLAYGHREGRARRRPLVVQRLIQPDFAQSDRIGVLFQLSMAASTARKTSHAGTTVIIPALTVADRGRPGICTEGVQPAAGNPVTLTL